MASRESGLKSDDDASEEESSDEASKMFVKKELAEAEKWDAKGVMVDQKTFEGRKSTRGFTISMGKAGDQSPEAGDFQRRDRRLHTLPSMLGRRGEYNLSEASQRALQERQDFLKQRFRRGSTSVMTPVATDEEIKECWDKNAVCHLYGKMTSLQKSGDERERELVCGDKLPSTLPPIISCTKGSKGPMDTAPNQDNYSMTYFKNGYTMACCMDGHGPNGHKVSTRVVQTVPYYFISSSSLPDIEPALQEAFERAQKDITSKSLEEGWDVQASGSTAVAVLWKENKIWTANVGDSRCVIGSENTRKVLFETKDHKPDSPEEHARIDANGGEVRSQTYPDGWTVHRIFVKGQDYPGLCMTRTLGDESVKAHGVVSTPEVEHLEVDMASQPFILLATDGVWEFLDSEFVVKAVAKKIQTDGPERTIQKLQREARKRWKKEEGEYCDDITSMLIQLR